MTQATPQAPPPAVPPASVEPKASPRTRRSARRVPLVPVLTAGAIILILFELVLFAYVPLMWAVVVNAVLAVIALLVWLRRRKVARTRRAAGRRSGQAGVIGGALSGGLPGRGGSTPGQAGGAKQARRGLGGLVSRLAGRGGRKGQVGAGPGGTSAAGAGPSTRSPGRVRSALGRALRGSSAGGPRRGGPSGPAGRGPGGPSSPKGGRLGGLLSKLRRSSPKGPSSSRGSAGKGTGSATRPSRMSGFLSKLRPSRSSRGGGSPSGVTSRRPSSSPGGGVASRRPSRLSRMVGGARSWLGFGGGPKAPAVKPSQSTSTPGPLAPPSPPKTAVRPNEGGSSVNKPARPAAPAGGGRKPPPAMGGGHIPMPAMPGMSGGGSALLQRLSEMNVFQFHQVASDVAESTSTEAEEIFKALATAAESQPNSVAHTELLQSLMAEQRALTARAQELRALARRGNEADYQRGEQPRGGNLSTESKADAREYRNQ